VNIAATTASPTLPTYVEPMLARPGQPFNDERYSFELKWDGTRSLCFIDAPGVVRLMNRRTRDMSARYPELCECLRTLPPGTLLDGEIIVPGADGCPDFERLQLREAARNPVSIPKLAKTTPATFIVFDQLYADFASCMDEPLRDRRARAKERVGQCGSKQVAFSEGVVGDGSTYFDAVCARGLEGVMAKRLDSRYRPGKRTDAWIKIKRSQEVACVVFGFVPDEEGRRDFRALVIAAAGADGALRCVGKVGSGFDGDARVAVNTYLWSHPAAKPVVACPYKARYVEPSLYCTVRYIERTSDGKLRWPVFRGLLDAQ
jgi:bifunctional non-homologous end joining protein LigD